VFKDVLEITVAKICREETTLRDMGTGSTVQTNNNDDNNNNGLK
jgi:hypothetical protein